jgi:hypothetical protein
MKRIILIIVAVITSLSLSAQEVAKKIVTIQEGTVLKVKSLSAFDSKVVNEGDIVDFVVFQDFEIDGKVVIKEGTIVSAFIESVEKAKGLGKAGTLKVQFNYTKTINGIKVPLRSTKGTQQGEGKVGGAVALAAVISPLFLLKKGKEAKITEGKVMEAYVSQDVKVEIE